MRRTIFRWPILLGLSLLIGMSVLILAGWAMMSWAQPGADSAREYRSNGEQIYFSATSQRGTSITADLGMGGMGGGMATCAGCHGPDGRGGQARLMLRSFDAPDIRYSTLTADELAHTRDGQEHIAYMDETVKRAITLGVNPTGQSLERLMPRWTMSDEDLNDLIDFLKSLS